jgi:hypothetical protein
MSLTIVKTLGLTLVLSLSQTRLGMLVTFLLPEFSLPHAHQAEKTQVQANLRHLNFWQPKQDITLGLRVLNPMT